MFDIAKALKLFVEIDKKFGPDYPDGDDKTFERLISLCREKKIPPETALNLVWFCRGIEEGIGPILSGEKQTDWYK